jgi:hypothetical protein
VISLQYCGVRKGCVEGTPDKLTYEDGENQGIFIQAKSSRKRRIFVQIVHREVSRRNIRYAGLTLAGTEMSNKLIEKYRPLATMSDK